MPDRLREEFYSPAHRSLGFTLHLSRDHGGCLPSPPRIKIKWNGNRIRDQLCRYIVSAKKGITSRARIGSS